LFTFNPFSSIIVLGDFPLSNISSTTCLPIAVDIVPSLITSINSATSFGVNLRSSIQVPSTFISLDISPIIQLDAAFGSFEILAASSKKSAIDVVNVNTWASYLGNPYSLINLACFSCGSSGIVFLTSSIHSSEILRVTKSPSGKYL